MRREGMDARSRPAKAGIQEGEVGVLRAGQSSPACKEEGIPAKRECDCATGFQPSLE